YDDTSYSIADVGPLENRELWVPLKEAMERWKRLRFEDYEFTFRWLCECIDAVVRPVKITVLDGTVNSVRRTRDNLLVNIMPASGSM
ncbi:MAG: DUF6174 domain-containing protein, partial [Chromatiales bacterium]|nr:DUF6174 domain-containing protein [Chromatiales bacterium]